MGVRMKKIQSSLFSDYFPIATGILIGLLLCHLVKLFMSQIMTYKKQVTTVAGKDYVSEETRWPGHVRIVHYPVYYG